MVVKAEETGRWGAVEEAEPVVPVEGYSIRDAVSAFLVDVSDVRGRGLSSPTLTKYRTVLKRLVTFTTGRGVLTLNKLDFRQLDAFRRTWPTGPLATKQNITRLRAFLAYCIKHRWIEENAALEMECPRDVVIEREPYTEAQMTAMLEAARTIKLESQRALSNDEIELFILVMRYSGISISDCALLEKSELRGDEIRLYRNKTRRNAKRVLVVVPLPPAILERLRKLPLQQGRYYFCHSLDTIDAQVAAWTRRLNYVFRAARITKAGSHRLRHTFATDLLTKGVSIELVSRWLGHSSVKITQDHYSHWIEDRVQAASDILRKLYGS